MTAISGNWKSFLNIHHLFIIVNQFFLYRIYDCKRWTVKINHVSKEGGFQILQRHILLYLGSCFNIISRNDIHHSHHGMFASILFTMIVVLCYNSNQNVKLLVLKFSPHIHTAQHQLKLKLYHILYVHTYRQREV